MTEIEGFTDYAARLRDFISRDSGGRGVARSGDETFNCLSRALFSLQFDAVEPYGRLCRARGVGPETASNWRDIPAVPAAAFKEFEMTSLLSTDRPRVFHSSGTTGQHPSRHFHNADSLALYEMSLLAWFGVGFLGDQGPDARISMLLLTPPPEAAPQSSLVHMLGAVRRAFGSGDSLFAGRLGARGAWEVDIDLATGWLRRAEKSGEPAALLGTAFSFVHLLDALAVCGVRFQLPGGSRVMETGGYKGRSREMSRAGLHAALTERFAVPLSHIVCEYGMSELSSQAYRSQLWSGPIGRPAAFWFPPWVRAMVISPETGRPVSDGESGLLRVLDLANVRSVLAVQTEDLAVCRGDGFDLLGRAASAEARGCSLMAP